MTNQIEFSIVLPCLNEVETLESCITKIKQSMIVSEIENQYEIVIADNGSTDGSQDLALKLGARVIQIEEKGYGNALLGGIKQAKGEYVIMADADDSYSLDKLEEFISELRSGADLVMGNRFAGVIEKGAMPFLHKYLGNPVLSFLGRLFFKAQIRDFHCGLRGFKRERILSLQLQTTGMEFASELVVRSVLEDFKISQVATDLKKDGRSRPPHLNTWRDGWRHLVFLLSFSPKWLFLYPGIVASVFGICGLAILWNGQASLGQINIGLQSMIFSSFTLNLGHQLIWFSVLSHINSSQKGFLPYSHIWMKLELFAKSKNLTISYIIMIVLGLVILTIQILGWISISFGDLQVQTAVKGAVYGSTLVLLGMQGFFSQFLFHIISMQKN